MMASCSGCGVETELYYGSVPLCSSIRISGKPSVSRRRQLSRSAAPFFRNVLGSTARTTEGAKEPPLYFSGQLGSEDNFRVGSSTQAVPVEEWDLPRALEPTVRPAMQARNDYNLVVIWATLIGLLVVALWLKVPLG